MSYWRSLFQLERCSYILWSWSPWIWSSRKPCFLCVVQLLSIWYYALRLNTYRLQLPFYFIKQFSRTVDSTWFCAFDFFADLKRINLGKHYKKERVNIFFGLCRTKDKLVNLEVTVVQWLCTCFKISEGIAFHMWEGETLKYECSLFQSIRVIVLIAERIDFPRVLLFSFLFALCTLSLHQLLQCWEATSYICC